MDFELPSRGLVFWPVSNGDSTTVVVDSETYLQIDLNHLEKSDDDDDASWPVVDELVNRLPRVGDRPYLASFALTHPDQDHCKGFTELLDRVEIGELWFTPRIFLEYKKDLCSDAAAFKQEAERRVHETINADGDPGSGNRVRVFGYSELLEEDEFEGFPTDRLAIPGTSISTIDETNVANKFSAFVHAPFKDDEAGDRNDTSLALQMSLYEESLKMCALMLGDLSYPVINRIFDKSTPLDLEWNVLLAPHHCSKSSMYWKDDDEEQETLKEHIVDAMEEASRSPNCVVSSSNKVPESNNKGDDPPHAKAKEQYETITESFLCTMDQDFPIVVQFSEQGIDFKAESVVGVSATEAANRAQGNQNAPTTPQTYGIR
ncbi:MAG: hypothetical protein OXO49_01980 [Gammaproteobacteria bacterium]|nr:hypothetical protein [Gammaproteobacteria bacterium]MDE0251273.1 hypothetical protein [Gammaproteobacteria bacterium]MDE0402042.1 hypothetical protein [Gammaproteobacteria bacterium]